MAIILQLTIFPFRSFLIIDFPFYKMPEAKGPETEALDSGVFSIPIENAPG